MNETKKNSILIVDDDIPNIRVVTDILGGEYTIFAARDGQHAIKAAQDRLPDLVLLDILMPGMDGYEVIAELKKSDKTRDIPVIFVTGLDSSEDEKKGLSLGAADYISKPFIPEVVKLRVQNQLIIVNQMHSLDKRLKQQALMTSVSQGFLTGAHLDTLLTNTLSMLGGFMEIARIQLYKLNDDKNALVCRNEWLNPALNLETHIGRELALEESAISIVNNFMANGKNFCIHSNDPQMKTAMMPYRTGFHDFITIPIFNKKTLTAVIDFSKEDDEREWTESEINLATLAGSIFSGVFERDAMERIIMAKELAEQSSRTKGEFLSRMSHEMRTPMNAIIGMTHLARDAKDPGKRDEYLEKAGSASRHLLRLIDDVLDIYDIEESKFDLDCLNFCFAEVVRMSIDSVNISIEEKQQTLSTDIDPAIPETLTGDGKRLEQVIGNLLSNACKFTQEQGAIQLRALLCDTDNNIATIQIEVIDNGIGIQEDQQESLFMPFEQADGGVDRKFAGAGLGLSISKHLVEMMGGRIWVESEPGKGSKFAFTVKLRKREPGDKDPNPSLLAGKKALVVDDNEINREIIIAMLEDTQMLIECAVNGNEALEIFSSDPEKFDIIIMDINMPEMDGVEATRRIRTFETELHSASQTPYRHIPIIALTANVLSDEVKKYFDAGMNGHIGKPVDFDQLMQALEKYTAPDTCY